VSPKDIEVTKQAPIFSCEFLKTPHLDNIVFHKNESAKGIVLHILPIDWWKYLNEALIKQYSWCLTCYLSAKNPTRMQMSIHQRSLFGWKAPINPTFEVELQTL
jgi:hypothetical protein